MKTLDFYPDFDDVLIKPKMSRLNSRKEVDLTTTIGSWKPIPIMSANMDTVTDIVSAFELLKANWIAVLHKYVSIPDITSLFNQIDEYNLSSEQKIDYRNLFISRGTSDRDKLKLIERLEQEPRIKSFCIDVANGHRLEILSYLKELKLKYPDKILMAGNIVTSEAAILYAKAGVDIIKCGIGPGCFKKGSKILTKEGLKNIEDIIPNKDYVLTHTNSYQKVLNKFFYNEKDKLISINGIESTLNHKYYVVLKEDSSKINAENIHLYAKWIKAVDLDKNIHLLVNLND